MRNILCCFKGGSSSQVAQEPPPPPPPPEPPEPSEPSDPSEQTDSSETVYDGFDEEYPFGDNELLNYVWRHDIELPDDRYPPDSDPNKYQLSPPLPLQSGAIFLWHEIVDGTENFSITNFLGQGDFGEVYRCDLPSIDMVGAAKIQNLDNPYAHPEFMAEITMLHGANHPNVIQLFGKCFGREQCVLVYELMPKGSLDHYLYANARPGPGLSQESLVLDWDKRMRIAVGVAEALVYLHEGLKVIHRDVQVSNVLLDEDFVPKLTDFGFAIKIVEDEDGVEMGSVIDPIKGTPGYIAPETEEFGLVSSKADVYSYGVFLFTLFTGRKAYDIERPLETRKLADWLMPVWSREEYMRVVVDVALGKRFSVEGLSRLFQAARMCIDPFAHGRPDMGFVEQMVREAAAYEVPEWPPVTERFSI